jgi:phosphoenolpyruvate carboxykinase (GTP)
MGKKLQNPPTIFHVNWFRVGPDGKFLWPGFGQNLRVLLWAIDRIKGRGAAVETPIGLVPTPDALRLDGLDLSASHVEELLRVDREEWAAEVPQIRAFFHRFGERLPPELDRSLGELSHRLEPAMV